MSFCVFVTFIIFTYHMLLCVFIMFSFRIYCYILLCVIIITLLFFLMYTYYKRTLVVSGFALPKRCLEMVFRPPWNVLTVIIHRLFSDAWVFIYYFKYWSLFFYLLFLTSYYSKLVSFTFYLVHSLSTWFTYSIISPLFRLGIASVHPTSGGLLSLLSD